MNLHLAGQTVMITGASQGIGEGAADAFAEEGCNLVLVARSVAKLEQIADRLRTSYGVDVAVRVADLTKPEAIEDIGAVRDVDVLVNNAGAIPGGDLAAVDARTWRQAWELKVFGYIDLSRKLYAAMKSRGSGVIINNIGASADMFDPSYIAGSTGNAGLVAFTRALGSRSLDHGVRVVGVSPGPVATERITRLVRDRAKGSSADMEAAFARFPLGRPAGVREIADLMVFLASRRSAYTSGTVFTVDGGLSSRKGW